jgi:hypothetical protein
LPQEIVVIVDGDDWLAYDGVFSFLNTLYADPDVWLTYGQYKKYPTGELGICKDFPAFVIATHAFRRYTWVSSYLRTFYAWLFKRIRIEDLMYQGVFFPMPPIWQLCFLCLRWQDFIVAVFMMFFIFIIEPMRSIFAVQ